MPVPPSAQIADSLLLGCDHSSVKVAVCPTVADEPTESRAGQLAAQLGLPLVAAPDPAYDMLLAVGPERLELRFPQQPALRPVYVDFVGGAMGYQCRTNRFGLLRQAVVGRGRPPSVIDATAGLGRDAFRLACAGCQVLAVERSRILAALLQDGLQRATQAPTIRERLGDRLHLVCTDARDLLKNLPASEAPDVIYLDPMFPPKKKSALVRKEMRVLRQLVGDDTDASELIELARAAARQRVIVKRMRHAPPLGPNPTRSYSDKTTRYDVYVA